MTNLNTSTEAPNTTETAIGFIPCYRLPFLSLFHADCMEIMKQYPDKYFDLAIVDPPYGIGFDGHNQIIGKQGNKKGFNSKKLYSVKEWDIERPSKYYFEELKRISVNQIIWGGNYFADLLTPTKGWIYWDKKPNGENLTFSDGELAYTSFNRPLKSFSYGWIGFEMLNSGEKKIHPTQKPIALYEWLLKKYAEKSFKILDTHLGSGSIALAVDKANRLDKMNLHLTACEIDKEYIDKAIKRISESIKQGTLSF